MTKEAMRFLALNSMLHGHSVLAGFMNDSAVMADCLDIDKEEAEMLVKKLDELPVEEPTNDPLTATFLNFFRTQAYAFLAMGDNIVSLEKFVGSDVEGQVEDDLRYMFLTHLLMDVAQGDEYWQPFIKDGVLHCTSADFKRVNECMLEAYQLYMSGPAGTTQGLQTFLRKYTSLEHYSRLNAAVLLKGLRQISRAKKNPIIYQQTLVNTPDLLTVYKHTGCIMAFRDMSQTSVNWLLDVEGVADSTICMVVDMTTLRNYLVRDMRDLEGVKVARGLGDGGKILFPGVV